ncbi:hypothetical protein L3Y34_007220 [Caenorhabditis briggsae]|uniref:Serpentine Receptor, class Z n=1 Tax=Caenorhabditis briggsae TaxID=6238 RepID=A0AAE8ZZB2_CAEBR|nr:hypothetical protein L3Y34_007220 [Caenorhabditis briggsae]
MNFFPYGFSKEEVYKQLVEVEDIIYFAIFLIPLILCNAVIRLVHYFIFEDNKKQRDSNSLFPLFVQSTQFSHRLMTLIHIIFFLHNICHIFHLEWLVDVLWYPMWINAYLIKVYTEIYIVVISLLSVSRYFVHFSLALPSVELTQKSVTSEIRWIAGLIISKDLVLFLWLIVIMELKKFHQIHTISDYYYGIHLNYQFLLYIAAIIQLPIISGAKKSSDSEINYLEKMVCFQTVGIGFIKMSMIPIFLTLLFKGVNDTVISVLFVMVDLFIVPIVAQISEFLYRPRAAVATQS